MRQTLRRFTSLSAAALTAALISCGVAEPEPLETEESSLLADDDSSAEIARAILEEPRAGALDAAAADCTVTVANARELMITALGVVEDPVRTTWTEFPANPKAAAWTFGKLMTDMAGTRDPSDFTLDWLAKWESAQAVNGFNVRARTAIRTLVTNPWLAASGGDGKRLDMTKAPFRLLAIVNRFDLRKLSSGNAGEGRFVFGVLDTRFTPARQTQFTVILEYKLPAATSADVRTWARNWHVLRDLVPGTAEYNDRLQALTDRFAGKNAAPTRPNGSSLGQLRTNEIALSAPWELREFNLSPTTGLLREVTVAQTPDSSLNPARGGSGTALRDYVNAKAEEIIAGTYVVPRNRNSAPFRGGSSLNNIDFWDARPGQITNARARHKFSLNTCNGCHGRETNTSFLQIRPREAGQVATLAGFLTGIDVRDPVTSTVRHFDDLARRNADLKKVLCALPQGGLPASDLDLARVH